MGGVVFKTVAEEFGRLVEHHTTQQLEETEPVSVEEMFQLEQKQFRLSKPAHGPRANGGSIGLADQLKKPAPKMTPQEVQRHQDHEAQECAHPTCRLCADPNYKWADRYMIGKKHGFEHVVDVLRNAAAAPARRDVSITVEGDDRQYYIGTYPSDRVTLVRYLATTLDPKIKGRVKVYDVPEQLKPQVPSILENIKRHLVDRGLLV